MNHYLVDIHWLPEAFEGTEFKTLTLNQHMVPQYGLTLSLVTLDQTKVGILKLIRSNLNVCNKNDNSAAIT